MAGGHYLTMEEIGRNLLHSLLHAFSDQTKGALDAHAQAKFQKRKEEALEACQNQLLRVLIRAWLERHPTPTARDIKAFLQNLNFSIWDLGLVGFKAACKAILLVKVATQDGGVKYRTWEPLPGVAADPTELILSDAITANKYWKEEELMLWMLVHRAVSLVKEPNSWEEKVELFMLPYMRLVEVQKASPLARSSFLLGIEAAEEAHAQRPLEMSTAHQAANEELLQLSGKLAFLDVAAWADGECFYDHMHGVGKVHQSILLKIHSIIAAAPDEGLTAVWEGSYQVQQAYLNKAGAFLLRLQKAQAAAGQGGAGRAGSSWAGSSRGAAAHAVVATGGGAEGGFDVAAGLPSTQGGVRIAPGLSASHSSNPAGVGDGSGSWHVGSAVRGQVGAMRGGRGAVAAGVQLSSLAGSYTPGGAGGSNALRGAGAGGDALGRGGAQPAFAPNVSMAHSSAVGGAGGLGGGGGPPVAGHAQQGGPAPSFVALGAAAISAPGSTLASGQSSHWVDGGQAPAYVEDGANQGGQASAGGDVEQSVSIGAMYGTSAVTPALSTGTGAASLPVEGLPAGEQMDVDQDV